MKKLFIIFEHLPLTILSILIMINFKDFSYTYIFLCLFSGWLIDLDHLFDYYYLIFRSKSRFQVQEFLNGIYFKRNKKIFIFFHSYEISIIIFVLGFIYNDYLYFICLSHFLHLMQDQKTNDVRLLAYFFIYRAINKFEIISVCK